MIFRLGISGRGVAAAEELGEEFGSGQIGEFKSEIRRDI